MAQQYESLKIVLDRLLRNHVLNGISLEAVIDYTIDFFDIVGVPSMYYEKFYETDIKDSRAKLPCDFAEDIQILLSPSKRGNFVPAISSTDTFHESYNCAGLKPTGDYTFSLNNNYIFTSLEKGYLKMQYRAIMTDDEGYPMIPSDRTFIRALEAFIKVEYFEILWDQGKIEDKRFQNAQTEYAWAVGQCETHMKRLSLSKAESFFNSFRTLVPRDNEFAKRFANTGTKEYLKAH